jgi:hypothetical protein
LYTDSKAFEATPENSEIKRGNKETYGKVTQFPLILEDAVKISLPPFNGLKILLAYSTLRPWGQRGKTG